MFLPNDNFLSYSIGKTWSLMLLDDSYAGNSSNNTSKRKAGPKGMDDMTMIPGEEYKTWVEDPTSLVSKRRRVSRVRECAIARNYLSSDRSELMHFLSLR